jgi:SAM-dependent methyltransferase
MHPGALKNGKSFFETYTQVGEGAVVVDIGAQDVNGSLKQVCPPSLEYIGVDFVAGNGVDVILEDPYRLPFDDASIDVAVSSSVFEHSEMFWVLFLEILRILKPAGLFYLNVPSNGNFHRYPVDCWRFYPDSGRALVTWAKRNGYNAVLLESFVSMQGSAPNDRWNDFVAVYLKDEAQIETFPNRVVDTKKDFKNGYVAGEAELRRPAIFSEDQTKLLAITKIISGVR